MMRPSALALAGCLSLLPAASAQETSPVASAPFWQRLREPQAARAQALLRQGRAQLVPALRSSLVWGQQAAAHRRVAVEGALARFERARALTPRDPELLFLTGRALSAWEQELNGELRQRSKEAIDCLLALRAIDPWFEAEAVAFELGMLYTREARFADAAAEYQRALALQLDDSAHSVTLGNLAEVTMLAGDVEGAVRLYERATHESSGSNRLLALWGQAVALDRLGERGEALSVAQRAVRDDQAPLHVLEQGSVFFVPTYERHYYEGLGALALARIAASELGTVRSAALPPVVIELSTLSPDSLGALQRACGAALGLSPLARGAAPFEGLAAGRELGLSDVLTPLHERVLAELSRGRNRTLAGALRAQPANEQSARVLSHLIEALVSFARYQSESREQSPWASDARSHLTQLARNVGAAQLRSNAKQHTLDRLAERTR